jgi:hypothetical protein
MWLVFVVWIGMIEDVDNVATHDRKPCEKDKDKIMFVKRLMKGSCEFT